MLESIDRILKQYEISHYGFLPIDEPLSYLPDAYYQPWEDIIADLPALIASGHFYDQIYSLPVLETSRLRSTPEWRRAYVILTFFTHAHIWTGEVPHETLPPNIAVPLLDVSEHLGLPPTATYPALNLWNCGLIADQADITNPENVVMRHTFTGTQDEAWFYAVSVSVEAKGVRAIQMMLECITAIEVENHAEILKCLQSFSNIVTDLGHILHRMHDHCGPQVFYHRIRPFLAGSRGMEKAGLPRGIFYDEGNGQGSWRQYSGGSNAQSTLIQFLDISLGVQHSASSSSSAGTSSSDDSRSISNINANNNTTTKSTTYKRQTYLNEMRQYMPVSHRQFLEHFAAIANIRAYATSPSVNPEISHAFNAAVDALTTFRDIHIKIVARYIVAPSRSMRTALMPDGETGRVTGSASGDSTAGGARAGNVVNIASASSRTSESGSGGKDELKGTGGTDLIAFLKQTRDETRAARAGPLQGRNQNQNQNQSNNVVAAVEA